MVTKAARALNSFLSTPITYSQGWFGNYLRYVYYKKRLRDLGVGCTIDQGVLIKKPEMISIGDHTLIDKNVILLGGEGIEIGRRVHIAVNCMIQGVGGVRIGSYGVISANTMIFSATDTVYGGKRVGSMIPPQYRNPVSKKLVNIEEDAWIGAGCIILPGVKIGEGAVVGAGSLVTKDIPSWKVAVGCPAKPIKDRPKVTLPDF